MEDDLNWSWCETLKWVERLPPKKNGRRPQKKMKKNGRRPQKK